MAGYLEDLDELILKCRNQKAREYIREAVAGYRSGAYRSAIVSCWIAVCYDLIEKFRELSLAGDKQAADKIEVLDAIHREDDTARSLKFEREILSFARDKLELISALEYEDLNRILKDRHRCAHPSLNAEGEQYSPPAELVRLHIHSAVTHLLQHEPAQGKFALDRVLAQINSKYFPSEYNSVLQAFQRGPVRRARPSLVRNLVTVLIKDLFLSGYLDYARMEKLSASLNAVNSMHPLEFSERCEAILPGIIEQCPDDELHYSVRCLMEVEGSWRFVGETQRRRILAYVENMPSVHFLWIDEMLSFDPVADAARNRVKAATVADFLHAAPLIVSREVIDRSIELYHQSESFEEANKIGRFISGSVSELTDEQLLALLSSIKDNRQITGSYTFPNLLEKISQHLATSSLNFEKLLRDNGLQEFFVSVVDKDESGEIPF